VGEYRTEKRVQGGITRPSVPIIKDDLSAKLWEITMRWDGDVRIVHERTAHQTGFLVRVQYKVDHLLRRHSLVSATQKYGSYSELS
jgi:hypothetical protein